MSISNPSHLLISRNPRSPAHPQLAPTLTSHHSPSSTFPPNLTLNPWPVQEPALAKRNVDNQTKDDEVDVDEEEVVNVHPTFTLDYSLPGNVKVIVASNTFWCHKEILWFASPFFQSLLEGNWAETNLLKPALDSRDSPTDTGPSCQFSFQSPIDKDDQVIREDDQSETTEIGSVYLDASEDGPSVAEILKELREMELQETDTVSNTEDDLAHPSIDNLKSHGTPLPLHPPPLGTLKTTTTPHQSRSASTNRRGRRRSGIRHSFSSAIRVSAGSDLRQEGNPIAIVELHEESAAAFQDFLYWCYPHLECKVTWTNVENLLALSLKLLTPSLQKLCEHFLMTHASGRPVMALMLAEQHGNVELYREASRFVLDQPSWDKDEMDTLDESTQLKLSQRRGWFLERLIKLGTIDVKREYTCRPDCPDPARCQVALDEKWRQAHLAVCRYGPPQPSVAYRCLRQLETFPTNPSLIMPHPLCQRAAQSWVITLFDRMFQPKISFSTSNPGTEKYWLWISLN